MFQRGGSGQLANATEKSKPGKGWDVTIKFNNTGRSLSKFWDLVMDREAWHATVHGVPKSWTRLSGWTKLTSDPEKFQRNSEWIRDWSDLKMNWKQNWRQGIQAPLGGSSALNENWVTRLISEGALGSDALPVDFVTLLSPQIFTSPCMLILAGDLACFSEKEIETVRKKHQVATTILTSYLHSYILNMKPVGLVVRFSAVVFAYVVHR